MNLLDRIITKVSPAAGLKRMGARAMLGAMGQYTGASTTRRATGTWVPALGSANTDLTEAERQTLIARTRDAERNQPLARAFMTRAATNIVGTGLKLKSEVDARALGLTEDQAGDYRRQIEGEFSRWAGSTECDAERTLNFYGLQNLVLLSAFTGGDAFVATPYIKRNGETYGTKLLVIESERVCNRNFGMDRKRLIRGIQMDQYGAPVAYHILKAHPSDYTNWADTNRWDVVPAFGPRTNRRRVFHVFFKERAGQVRGVPILNPVLEPLKQLERYTNAELMASVVNSFFTVFVKTEEGDGLGRMVADTTVNQQPVEPGANAKDEVKMGYGNIVDLGLNEDVTFADPNRPNQSFEPFILAVMRQIASALEMPLDELLLVYNNSYSAARASMLQAWKFYTARRVWLARMLCQPAFVLFLDEVVARGRVELPDYGNPDKRQLYAKASWYGPARGAIDEDKEAKSAERRIKIGISTRAQESLEMKGADWETGTFPQSVREKRLMEEAEMVWEVEGKNPMKDRDQDDTPEGSEDGNE